MYDLILAKGNVYDGLGNPARKIDIAIKDDRIAALGNLKSHYSYHKTININNLAVSPGFIDIHSHSDVYYLANPQAESKVQQGVTTEVIGNCGVSAAPLYGEFKLRRKQEWERLGIDITWNSFKEYINRLSDQGIGVNVVPLIGHGNIRGAVKGFSRGFVTKKDKKKMYNLLCKLLEQGAWGLSTGLIYIPSMYADTRELIDIIKIVAQYHGIYTTHIRGEGDSLLEAIEEAVYISRETNVNLQISHLKTGSPENWNKLPKVFNIIENGIQRGLNINCDRYPYIASNTDLDVIMPDWFHRMTERKRRSGLVNYKNELQQYLKGFLDQGWTDRIWIGRVKNKANKWVQGMSIRNIAKRKQTKPEDMVIRLLKEEDFSVQAMFFCMIEDNLKKILKKSYVMIGSDSSLRTVKGPLAIGHPHPRVFGTFPKVISSYTGKGKISLSKAIWKMTGMPAKKLGLYNRGIIKKDTYADLVVFNPDKIKDKATYKKPFQYPKGIKFVLVNGTIVVENGQPTGKLPGRVLLKTQTIYPRKFL